MQQENVGKHTCCLRMLLDKGKLTIDAVETDRYNYNVCDNGKM